MISSESQSTADRARRACPTKAPPRRLPCVRTITGAKSLTGAIERSKSETENRPSPPKPHLKAPASGAHFGVITIRRIQRTGHAGGDTAANCNKPFDTNHLHRFMEVHLAVQNSRPPKRHNCATAMRRKFSRKKTLLLHKFRLRFPPFKSLILLLRSSSCYLSPERSRTHS